MWRLLTWFYTADPSSFTSPSPSLRLSAGSAPRLQEDRAKFSDFLPALMGQAVGGSWDGWVVAGFSCRLSPPAADRGDESSLFSGPSCLGDQNDPAGGGFMWKDHERLVLQVLEDVLCFFPHLVVQGSGQVRWSLLEAILSTKSSSRPARWFRITTVSHIPTAVSEYHSQEPRLDRLVASG